MSHLEKKMLDDLAHVVPEVSIQDASRPPDSTTRRVHFSLWQTLGMNFSITCSPLAVGAYLSLVIGLGGSPFYIWGFLFASAFQLMTCVALAELASAMPHSSGPAFWIRRLSPAKWASFLGYLTGWTTNAFWWFLCTANYLYMAQLTAGLAQAYHPTYNPRQWHIYLIYIAYSLGPFVLNLPHFFKIVPYSMSAGVFVINATSIFILVSLLVRATPKPTAHQVFVEVVNDSGWSSNGVVFFIALLPGTLTVNAFDSVTHITDEVENPSKQIPLVMMGGATFTAIAAFLMTIVYSFSVVNSANLLAPFSGQPLLQLVYDATRSEVITVISILGVLVSFFIASTGCFASWNRLYWSVSVNDDLPFSRLTSRLSSRDNLPVNAMIANLILVIAIGAIQIGSLTALNAVIGGAIICITGTYALTFALALYRGRDILAKDRWLDMGRFGTALQIVGMLWSAFISVWLSFPLYLPVTLDYMNWASVVFVGTMACAVIFYIVSRKALRK